jgi:hypothetical protein
LVVRDGKKSFSVVTIDASAKCGCKSPNSQSEKENGVERKTTEEIQVGQLVRDSGAIDDNQAFSDPQT